ncbi:MAG: DUF5313 family protein [Mycobacteriales bacterium]
MPDLGVVPPLSSRLRYAWGARLPAYRQWVRHDLTDAGWRWRALRRLLVQLLPFLVALAFLPGPGYLHAMMPLFLLLASLFTAAAYADDIRDRRLRQHDLEPPPSNPDELRR